MAFCALLITPAVAENVAVSACAGTVTDPGTVSAPLVLASVTTAPPVGAAVLNLTVQLDDAPLLNDAGVHTRELTSVGPREMAAVWLLVL